MTKTLLLIEDSVTTQHVVQTAFEHDDMHVITTTTLDDALRELQSAIPDVIVADASLPEVDGFQLCQILRDMERLRHIPIVLLTSGFASYDQAQGERLGVAGHLAKPFEAHALRQLVQQVCVALPHTAASALHSTAQTTTAAASRAEATVSAPDALPKRQDLTELEAVMAQWTPVESSLAAPSDTISTDALGRLLLQVIRDTLQTRLSAILEQLTPQILAAVQDVITRKTPELLEVLLQREIDKLKQAVDVDDRHGE
jgi:CheY-like chemotaxis protein